MATSIYSNSVLKAANNEFDEEIRESAKGDKRLQKKVLRTLQKANRRIENVEKKGLASPAVKAVYAEKGVRKRYTVFSIAYLDFENPNDWEMIKYEYGRALNFLNNPTSTARGASQYIRYQARNLKNISFDDANKIIDIATSPIIGDYGNVNIFSYNDILDELRDSLFLDVKDSMYESNHSFADRLENMLLDVISSTVTDNFLDRFF